MNKIITFLKGKKTYFVGALAIIFAILGFYFKTIDATQMVEAIFAALSLMGIRNGITTEAEKIALKVAQPEITTVTLDPATTSLPQA